MLRITVTETPTEQRWVLQGRLAGPWIPEFRSAWKRTREGRRERACVVDLNDVTVVDREGERLLLALVRLGVRCVARGVYLRHVLGELRLRRHAAARAGSGRASPG